MTKVAVFRPTGNLDIYTLSLCYQNLAYLVLEQVQVDERETRKMSKFAHQVHKSYHSSASQDSDGSEEYVEAQPLEFINVFDIFQNKGIVPNIKMNASILADRSRHQLSKITNGFIVSILTDLSRQIITYLIIILINVQKLFQRNTELRNEDMLLLKYRDFERILIFENDIKLPAFKSLGSQGTE